MPSRLVIGNRIVGGYRLQEAKQPKRYHASQLVNRAGEPVDVYAPVLPEQAQFIAGEPVEDPDEGVTYRIIAKMDPLDGWASTEWWQKRWTCSHKAIIELVERGLIDAAMHEGSRVKRYRCRDEHGARAYLKKRGAKRGR